jgi:hypothetical protein
LVVVILGSIWKKWRLFADLLWSKRGEMRGKRGLETAYFGTVIRRTCYLDLFFERWALPESRAVGGTSTLKLAYCFGDIGGSDADEAERSGGGSSGDVACRRLPD